MSTGADILAERELVRRQILSCTACELHLAHQSPVPFRGPTPALIAVLGMAPGADEHREGKPFCGPAGSLMTDLMTKVKLPADRAFFCNANSCQPTPPPNREQTPAELAACRPNLAAQLRISHAPYLIIVGKMALQSLRPDLKNDLGNIQGNGIRWGRGDVIAGIAMDWADELQAIVTYHPSAAKRNPAYKPMIEAALRSMREGMGQGHVNLLEWCVKCKNGDVVEFDQNGVGYCERHWATKEMKQEGLFE